MKRFIALCVVLLSVFNLAACKKEANKNDANKVDSNISDIEVTSGTFNYWDEIEFPITIDCVPDHTAAITVTEGIVAGFQKNGMFPDYCPQSVFFDTERQLWIVTFYPDDQQEGASLSIAIRKDNSQVVKMWVDE